MKFLLLLILSFNCFSETWIPASKVGLEQNGDFVLSKSKKFCEEKNKENCVYSEGEYNYRYFELKSIMVPNFENQTGATKSETESCVAVSDDVLTASVNEAQTQEENCQAKLEVKECFDVDERPIKNLDLMQVYCSKPIYEMVDSGRKRAVINPGLKSSYENAKAQEESQKQAKLNALKGLKLKLENSQDLTNAELREALIHLLRGL